MEKTKPKKTKHRSISQMGTYTSCGRKYKYTYIDNKKTMKENSDLVLGLALHKAQEFNYKQKIDSRKDLPLEEIEDFMVEYLITAFKNNEDNEDFFKIKYNKKQTGDGLIILAKSMLKELYTQVMVNTQPLFVELPVVIEILGQKFLMYIDLIDEDWVVRDLKTSGQKFSEASIDNSTQLIGYALGFRTKFGRKETAVQYDVVTKNKAPQIQKLRTVISDAKIARFLNSLEQINKGIEAEIFPPVDNQMTCSWCDFKDICDEDNSLPDAKELLKRLQNIKEVKDDRGLEKSNK